MKRALVGMVAAAVLSSAMAAEGNKIGIVDLQRIMQSAPQMKVVQEKLEKEFRPRRDKLMSMEESLKADMQRFKRDGAVLSAAQKRDLEKKIVTAQQTFEREGQQYQQELSTANNEAMESLYNRVRKAIEIVAQNDKYDVILQKEAAPFSGAQLDVTDKVLKNIQ